MNYVLAAILLAIGGYDTYLALTSGNTLSKQWQKLFRPLIDIIFFILGIFVVCLLHYWFPSIDFTIWAITLAFWGHITFANKETYGE